MRKLASNRQAYSSPRFRRPASTLERHVASPFACGSLSFGFSGVDCPLHRSSHNNKCKCPTSRQSARQRKPKATIRFSLLTRQVSTPSSASMGNASATSRTDDKSNNTAGEGKIRDGAVRVPVGGTDTAGWQSDRSGPSAVGLMRCRPLLSPSSSCIPSNERKQ